MRPRVSGRKKIINIEVEINEIKKQKNSREKSIKLKAKSLRTAGTLINF